jgi:hypothetical protein
MKSGTCAHLAKVFAVITGRSATACAMETELLDAGRGAEAAYAELPE